MSATSCPVPEGRGMYCRTSLPDLLTAKSRPEEDLFRLRALFSMPSLCMTNSSNGTEFSAPDHLGTREMRERSLCTAGAVVAAGASGDTRCFNPLISALAVSRFVRSFV